MPVRVVGEYLPYARLVLRHLRDRNTSVAGFRFWLEKAGEILAVELSRELSWRKVTVETPLARTTELELERPPLIVSVLGAATFLVYGLSRVYPEAPLALVSAKRIEENDSVEVRVYYKRLPREWKGEVIAADPMLATGKTIAGIVDLAKDIGASKVLIATVISSRQGIEYVLGKHPDVTIYTLAVDPELNDKAFIVPGLGDAGDRSLGVEY